MRDLTMIRWRDVAFIIGCAFLLSLSLLMIAAIGGCASSGVIGYDGADGTSMLIRTPSEAVSSGTFEITADGAVRANTGAQQKRTGAMIAAENAKLGWFIGPIVALVGIGLLVAKKWMPLIPTTAGTYTILAGVAIVVLAVALPSIPWWAWMIGAGGAVAVGLWLVMPGIMANMRNGVVKTTIVNN